MIIDNCQITILDGELPNEEIAAYVARGRELYDKRLNGIDIRVDGEFVDLSYHLEKIPF